VDPLDRDVVVAALEANLRHIERIVAQLAEAAAVARSAPERWSPLETLEHLAVVERGVHRAITSASGSGPTPLRTRALDAVIAGLATLPRKVSAPGMVTPSGRFGSTGETLQVFRERRITTLDLARALDVEWESHHSPHPLFGPLDIGQWLLLAATHGERHALQMTNG
jgi:hypothetical protein